MRLMPLIGLLFVALLLATGLFNRPAEEQRKSQMVGYHVGNFTIPSLLSEIPMTPALWKDKIVVVNFFAAWCEACLVEHPVLMRMAASGKVEVIGIAWKDDAKDITEWLQKHGNPYHHIGIDEKGVTTLNFGLSGAPETYILDQKGNIAYNYKAPITDELLDTVILPMVEHLRGQNAAPTAR